MPEPATSAFLAALEETQWLRPERLLLYQRRLLDRLVRHARAETDFYRDRLKPLFRSDDSIDWERWDEIPIVRREDAEAKLPAMVARNMVPQAGDATERTTSGSTGKPFRHFTSAIQNIADACANERFHRWHGHDPAALAAFIRSSREPGAQYPEGLPSAGWRMEHPESRGITLSIIGTTIDQQVEWLQRTRPQHLLSYPSNVREIARTCAAAGLRLDLSAVMTYGEALSPESSAEIGAYFGAPPADRYGATEVGLIAAMCPHSHRHHVMAELVLVEILDERGRPAEPGASGRVIITPFYNHAMPLIRYDIEDMAVAAAEPCGCGRSLPTLDAVLGRTRDIFRFSDGTSIWPDVPMREIRKYVPHRQQQIVQVALDRVELRYVPLSPGQVIDLPGLTQMMRTVLHPSIDVTAVAVPSIPRSDGGKYADFVGLPAEVRRGR